MPGDDDDSPEQTWDPTSELDPVKLQAEGIAMMKEAFARMDADKKARAKADLDCAASPAAPPAGLCSYSPPPAPTLEQAAGRLKKIWDEIQRTSQDAPIEIKVEMFRALNMAYLKEAPIYAVGGEASVSSEREDADLLGPPPA